ncbi:MAG: transposase [Nitrospirota bacterium]
MNILKAEKKLAVITALTEGCSIRSIVRMTGVDKKTIMKLLVEVGTKCEQIMNEKMRGIRCETVECDEIWTFVGKKKGVMKSEERKSNPELGNQYTYIALDPVSKMIPAFHVGKRDSVNTHQFIEDLSRRIEGSPQVSTDAWGPYSPAIARYFGNRATYATITKFYASENPGAGRYAPPRVSGSQITEVLGVPDYSKVCTSYVERQNLTLRMKIARFHRLSLAFSKKLVNLKAAVALYFWTYNFCLIHGSIRMMPAMAAGITGRIWELKEVVA